MWCKSQSLVVLYPTVHAWEQDLPMHISCLIKPLPFLNDDLIRPYLHLHIHALIFHEYNIHDMLHQTPKHLCLLKKLNPQIARDYFCISDQ